MLMNNIVEKCWISLWVPYRSLNIGVCCENYRIILFDLLLVKIDHVKIESLNKINNELVLDKLPCYTHSVMIIYLT